MFGPQVLPDELSQYLRLRHYYARRSVEDSGAESDKKGKGKVSQLLLARPAARIMANCARVYFPGQTVDTTVSIDEDSLETVEELLFEFKGVVSRCTLATPAATSDGIRDAPGGLV